MSDNRSGDGTGSAADGRAFGEPVDLSAVMHDEQLINALLRDEGEVRTDSEDEFEIAALFSAARYAVLNVPIDFEITDDQIAAALPQGSPATHTRTRRLLTSLAAGAASVAMVLGGLAIVANHAGDTPKAPEGQYQQVVSASMIRADLDEVRELLDNGDVERGVELINSTTSLMDKLDRTAEFDELNMIRVQLWARATGQPEASAPTVGPVSVTPPKAKRPAVNPPVVRPPSLPEFVVPPLPEWQPLPEWPPLPDWQLPQFPGSQPGPEAPAPEPTVPTTQTPVPPSSTPEASTTRTPRPQTSPASTTAPAAPTSTVADD